MRKIFPAILLLACLLPISAFAAAEPDPLLWPEEQRAFFQDGPGLLLTVEQLDAFLAADDAGRERFLRGFLASDELREGIERRSLLAFTQFESPADARWQLLFLRGEPAERKVIDCGIAFKPLELWTYGSPAGPSTLVVYKPSADDAYRLWLPIDSKRAIYTDEMAYLLDQFEELQGMISGRRPDLQLCPDTQEVDRATGIEGVRGTLTGTVTRQRQQAGEIKEPVKVREFRWSRPQDRARFLAAPESVAVWARQAAATHLPEAPRPLELSAPDWDFPRRQGQRLVARLLLGVEPGGGLVVTDEEGKSLVRLTVEGMVENEGRLFEPFRVRYRLPPPAEDAPAALLLERPLRPGQTFLLRLKVRDEVSGAEARLARAFRVPSAPETRLTLAAAAAAGGEPISPERVVGRDTLLLMPPPDEVVLGVWRAEALVTGDRIVKVVFLVDGKAQLSRTKPPFTAEVRLARLPKDQVIRVEGYDAAGELVTFDELTLNQPRGSFRVAITDPARGSRPTGKIMARAQVIVPDEHRVESVEFRVDDRSVVILRQAPWQAEIVVPTKEEIAYLTVIAKLEDGSQAEDTRFLRAPANLEEVEVNLVELYTTVTDSSGEPVRDLKAEDFEVLEAGKKQEVVKFERVENLPLNLGVVIDTSSSMASSLVEAQRAAAGFLKNVVSSKDRSFALGFSSRPYLLMPPTDDVDAVGQSLEGLRALGATALHDALITGLYYFRATRGQRALVLLSDGDDTASNAPFASALEYARKSGVAIYPIGLGISTMDLDVRTKLSNLAEATGGRAFFIGRSEELAEVYDQIEEELRSRYFLAYDTDQAPGDEGFRPVEVKVKRRGLKARTARGYYP